MDDARVKATVEQYAELYQPLITADDAADIARIPLGTVHDWSSRGFFDGFKSKRGRRILLNRDDFVRFLVAHAAAAVRSSG
jgi:hypothetical protein